MIDPVIFYLETVDAGQEVCRIPRSDLVYPDKVIDTCSSTPHCPRRKFEVQRVPTFTLVMESATLVFGTVVGLALLHLLLLGYLGSRRNAGAVGGDGTGDSGASVANEHSLADAHEDGDEQRSSRPGSPHEDDDVVRCRDCGAENEHGYRFCRYCVAELPGGTPIQQAGAAPIGGMG